MASYYAGLLTSEFYVAMTAKDGVHFELVTVKAIGLTLVKVSLAALFFSAALSLPAFFPKAITLSGIGYTSSRLRLLWRLSLGRRLHSAYFHNRRLTALNAPDAPLDNPDQRLTQGREEASGAAIG